MYRHNRSEGRMETRITRSKAAKLGAHQVLMPASSNKQSNKSGQSNISGGSPVVGTKSAIGSSGTGLVTVFVDENVFVHPNKRSGSSRNAGHVIVQKQSNPQITLISLETKKMQISENELSMNGAPEGDLYDVQVLSDAEMFAFDSTEMAEAAFHTACSLKKESSSWADLFSVVEVIRRLALHHQRMLLSSALLGEGVDSAIEAVTSLRSSTIRNGILCLKALAAVTNMDSDHICRIIATLMTRTSSGPRFICETATSAVEDTIASLSPQLSIDALASSTILKNGDSAGKAFVFIAQSVIRLCSSNITQGACAAEKCGNNALICVGGGATSGSSSAGESTAARVGIVLRLLSRGLSARTPVARETSRLALKRLKAHMGDEAFTTAVAESLPDLLGREVHREVEAQAKPPGFATIRPSSASATTSSSSSSFSSFRPSSTSSNPSRFQPPTRGGASTSSSSSSSSSSLSSSLSSSSSSSSSSKGSSGAVGMRPAGLVQAPAKRFASFKPFGSAAFRPNSSTPATAPLVTVFSSFPEATASGTGSGFVGGSGSRPHWMTTDPAPRPSIRDQVMMHQQQQKPSAQVQTTSRGSVSIVLPGSASSSSSDTLTKEDDRMVFDI